MVDTSQDIGNSEEASRVGREILAMHFPWLLTQLLVKPPNSIHSAFFIPGFTFSCGPLFLSFYMLST